MKKINHKEFAKNFTAKLDNAPLISVDKTSSILNRNIVSGKLCRPPRRKTRTS